MVTIYRLDALLFQFFMICIQISQVHYISKNCPQIVVIHTVKDFSLVNEAKVDICQKFSCFFNDPVHVVSLTSGSSAFSKTSLNIWQFMVHVLLNLAWRNLSITLLACEMSAIFI